jgi:hypothetical protein
MVERNIKIVVKEEDYEEFIKFCNEDYEIEDGEDLEETVTQMLENEPVENLSCCPYVRYEDETW